MQPTNQSNHNQKENMPHIVWLTAFFLIVLVIATISVVGSFLYRYAHQSDCQISLYDGQIDRTTGIIKNAVSQKSAAMNPVLKSQAIQYSGAKARKQTRQNAFEVDDATQVWKTQTAIELFKTEYKNANGDVTVRSAEGNKVIAPGTEGSYTFSLKNTSDSSANYKVWVEAKLNSDMTGMPLETRMASDSGWLLGGKSTWEQADALDGVSTTESIDAGRTADYTIYWQWPFEQDKDLEDTSLGDVSVDQKMSYTVTIYTLTATDTENDVEKDQNALQHMIKTVKTGDHATLLLWAILLAASTGILICLFILKRRKNDKENEHNEPEQRREQKE